ncbi:succinate dehydrogenase assembly factor 4, mitochondrial isoform X1 [Desmodus rotundus]|uniref:succinate dehydrogenase assembly factor 4, mitochondrial isoform X1 n=1 Tax=Desmodus rotundus TaxID=9430 RepID=UPI002381112A|nr:succinate dehydrogenase assembly factor 4, mitochondrial isoform X1 [Desmodus rotundus]
MTVSAVHGLRRLLGRAPATAWRAARSPLLCHSLRKTSSSQGGKSEPTKQSLKKPKLPEGRFDAPEDTYLEKEPLTKKPGDLQKVICGNGNASLKSTPVGSSADCEPQLLPHWIHYCVSAEVMLFLLFLADK